MERGWEAVGVDRVVGEDAFDYLVQFLLLFYVLLVNLFFERQSLFFFWKLLDQLVLFEFIFDDPLLQEAEAFSSEQLILFFLSQAQFLFLVGQSYFFINSFKMVRFRPFELVVLCNRQLQKLWGPRRLLETEIIDLVTLLVLFLVNAQIDFDLLILDQLLGLLNLNYFSDLLIGHQFDPLLIAFVQAHVD